MSPVCPVCGEPVIEWIETAQAVHCKTKERGWTKHPKTVATGNPDSWEWLPDR